MKRAQAVIASALVVLCSGAPPARAAQASNPGVRGGIGTDIGGGVAYGGGVSYVPLSDPAGSWEFGLVVYGGGSKTTDHEYFTYDDKTTVLAFGVLANRLFHYQPLKRGGFGIAGLGAGAVSVKWEERSTGDITLGTPLPGGGSMQSLSGTRGGLIVNLGAGYAFAGPVDVRIEAPILFISGPPGNASAVAPALTLTAGLRF